MAPQTFPQPTTTTTTAPKTTTTTLTQTTTSTGSTTIETTTTTTSTVTDSTTSTTSSTVTSTTRALTLAPPTTITTTTAAPFSSTELTSSSAEPSSSSSFGTSTTSSPFTLETTTTTDGTTTNSTTINGTYTSSTSLAGENTQTITYDSTTPEGTTTTTTTTITTTANGETSVSSSTVDPSKTTSQQSTPEITSSRAQNQSSSSSRATSTPENRSTSTTFFPTVANATTTRPQLGAVTNNTGAYAGAGVAIFLLALLAAAAVRYREPIKKALTKKKVQPRTQREEDAQELKPVTTRTPVERGAIVSKQTVSITNQELEDVGIKPTQVNMELAVAMKNIGAKINSRNLVTCKRTLNHLTGASNPDFQSLDQASRSIKVTSGMSIFASKESFDQALKNYNDRYRAVRGYKTAPLAIEYAAQEAVYESAYDMLAENSVDKPDIVAVAAPVYEVAQSDYEVPIAQDNYDERLLDEALKGASPNEYSALTQHQTDDDFAGLDPDLFNPMESRRVAGGYAVPWPAPQNDYLEPQPLRQRTQPIAKGFSAATPTGRNPAIAVANQPLYEYGAAENLQPLESEEDAIYDSGDNIRQQVKYAKIRHAQETLKATGFVMSDEDLYGFLGTEEDEDIYQNQESATTSPTVDTNTDEAAARGYLTLYPDHNMAEQEEGSTPPSSATSVRRSSIRNEATLNQLKTPTSKTIV